MAWPPKVINIEQWRGKRECKEPAHSSQLVDVMKELERLRATAAPDRSLDIESHIVALMLAGQAALPALARYLDWYERENRSRLATSEYVDRVRAIYSERTIPYPDGAA